MENAVVFGIGKKFFELESIIRSEYKIVAIIDNDQNKNGVFYKGIEIISPNKMKEFDFEKILITSMYEVEIIQQLLKMGIEKNRIIPYYPKSRIRNTQLISINDDGSIHAKFNTIKFNLINASDSCIMNEVFFRGIYCLHSYEKECIVIDIGMNVGLSTLFFASYHNVKYVYSFEPFTETYGQALANIKLNDKKFVNKIKHFNFALSNYNGKQSFRYNKKLPGSMRIEDGSHPCSISHEDSSSIEIKEAGLIIKDILEKHKDMRIIMKVDCEGSEYKIFKSLEQYQLIDKINILMMETHDGREAEIEFYLNKYHFTYFKNCSNGEEKLGMIYAASKGNH